MLINLIIYLQTMPPWPSFTSSTICLNLVCTILGFLVSSSFCHKSPCLDTFWLNIHDTCIKCTECDEQLIVLRPCQPHKDTVCGTFNDLERDLDDWLTQTEKSISSNWREVRFQVALTIVGSHAFLLIHIENA